MSARRNNFIRAGFSLIELLIAMLIILILVVISFPTYRLLMDRTSGAVCLSRQHGLGQAMLMWVNDNGGTICSKRSGAGSGGYIWGAQLLANGYISAKEAFVCPSAPRLVDFENVNWKWYTYALNMFDPNAVVLSNDTSGFQYFANTHRITAPQAYPLFMDSNVGSGPDATQTFRMTSQKGGGIDAAAVQLRHQNKAYLTFFDGHTEAMNEAQLLSIGFHAFYKADGTFYKK